MSGMNPKKVLVAAKGFQGRGKNCITIARRRVTKAMQHNYIGRKNRRREFRKQWIQRVNAGVREYNIPYSRFIDGMKKSDIALNRKMLAEMAVYEPYSFGAVVEQTKELAQIPER